MMGLETIVALNKEAGDKARARCAEPYVIPEDWDTYRTGYRSTMIGKGLPNLGYHVPEGWKQTTRENGSGVSLDEAKGLVLVDKGGFGEDDGGPAITIREFIEKWVRPGYGYGMVEEGQFQVVIGEFEKEE